jgi:hypothetical protein
MQAVHKLSYSFEELSLQAGRLYTHRDSHYRDSHVPVRHSTACHVSSSVHSRTTVRARSGHGQAQDLSLTVSGLCECPERTESLR